MALPSGITGITTFNRITNYIIYEDTTDWAAEGVDFGSGDTVLQTITVTYETTSGTVIAGSNTLDPQNSTVSNICQIPLSDTVPLPSNYTIKILTEIAYFGGADVSYTTSDTYTYSLTDPTICLEVTVNCAGGTITSEDITTYGDYTTLTRAHTLYPPPASGASSVTANLSEIVANTLYTTTWTANLISTVTYTQNDGLIIVVELEGTKEVPVLCDNNLNRLECCLEKLNDNYNYLVDSGSLTQAKMLLDTRINPTFRALSLYLTALTAGNATKMQKNYTAMLLYSGCSEDCGCSSTIPSLVVPTTTSTTNFIVDSPDNSITVVPDISGTVTTYHIQVSAAIQAALAALRNTTITSVDGSVTIVQSGGVNYDLSVVVDNNNFPNLLSKRLLLTNTGATFTLSMTDILLSGTAFANITPVAALDATWAIISLTNFINLDALSAIIEYTAQANVMRTNTAKVNTNNKNVEAEIFWLDHTVNNGELYIRLYDAATGSPYTLADLAVSGVDNIDVALTLTSAPSQ